MYPASIKNLIPVVTSGGEERAAPPNTRLLDTEERVRRRRLLTNRVILFFLTSATQLLDGDVDVFLGQNESLDDLPVVLGYDRSTLFSSTVVRIDCGTTLSSSKKTHGDGQISSGLLNGLIGHQSTQDAAPHFGQRHL